MFIPCRGLGYVSNHIPLQVRYIKSRKENLIVTCVGKSFHTYGISHFGLLSVGSLHHSDITCITSDTYHVYTSCNHIIYAWRRGTELKHTYRGHEQNVRHMLPFGVHLISVDEASTVRVWDIKDESLFLELTFSNEHFEISSVLHPSTYVNKILFGSEQGEMQLWNLKSAKMIYNFKGWDSPITCLEQAPALDVVAVGLANGRIILHNIKFDETVLEFMQDWGAITSISFRTDGSPIMATGSTIGHIVFWDLEERKVHSQLLAAHDGPVTGMVCLPNEPLVITSSPDNTLKLWIFDMTDGGARLLRIREGHAATPNYVRFHGANGHNILSASGDSTIRIYNTQTEMFNKSLGKASYNRRVSKKRGRAADDPLKMPPIIEFTSETTREKEWDNIAAIHTGLSMVTTWSYDKKKMGDLKLLPERLHKKKNRNHDIEVCATCISITHCGNFVLIGYSSGHVDRFNIQSGLIRDSYGTPSAHSVAIRGVATDSLNQKVITGCGDGRIKFWKFKNKGAPNYHSLDLSEPIRFFRKHQESSMLAVALEDFTVNILDIDTHNVVRQFSGHTAHLCDATFSPDSRWLVTSSMDCSIRTWDIPSAQLVDQFRTETACTSLSMSPTGETLATSHVDYLGIFLWTNRSLYVKMTIQALDSDEEPPLVVLPECRMDQDFEDFSDIVKDDEFLSPEQIHKELLTLSGLSTSRWQNLLKIDVIRKRNKPKAGFKAPKHAPFFLPTISGLNFQFDLQKNNEDGTSSKIITTKTMVNLTEFGKLVEATTSTNDFTLVLDKLKTLGPSGIDFEIKSLAPEGGGTVNVMLQFMKFIVSMLQSNKDFELVQAYLAVFLKSHGDVIASEDSLKSFMPNVQSCLSIGWNRIQEKLMYNICIVEHLKSM